MRFAMMCNSKQAPSKQRRIAVVIGAVLAAVSLGSAPAPAVAQSPFNSFSGNWSGAGKVMFTGGSTEAVSCRAYYTPKDAGTSLGRRWGRPGPGRDGRGHHHRRDRQEKECR